jgi:capsular exopolysaccharide synthesis family protein
MADIFVDSDEKSQPQGFTLDFKRVLARAIRFWYFIILSLFVTLTVAFYKNRYTQKTYPVYASIVIREMQETAGGEFIYKNSLLDGYRNYLNEPYIIRSYPLVEKVITDLSFHISFYREGYFMTTEAYDYVPVKATWCNDKVFKSGQFLFTLKDETHYTLSKFSSTISEQEQRYVIGDSIVVDGYSLCIRRIPERSIKSYIDIPFLMNVSNPTSVAGSYIGRLGVEWAEEGAGIINLSITGTNPEKEIDFINKLVQEYSQRDLDKKNQTAEQTIQFIRKQLVDIKDSLRTVEYQLERFGNSSRVKDMSAEAQRMFAKVEAFELQKAELLIRQNYYQYLTEYLSTSKGNLDQVILPSSMGINDPVLTSLLTKMIDLQLEMKTFLNPEQNSNPIVTAKVARINEIKKNVDEALNALRSTDKIKMNFLKKQLTDAEKQLQLLPASERQLIAVQRNYSLLENLYVFLMQKLSEAGISKASNISDIIAVNPPMRGGAISPQPIQNYTIALVLGLVLPLIVFTVFELINNKVQSKEDIDKVTAIPFIGGVGHNGSESGLAVKEKPKSGLAESFRALRSNLNFFTGDKAKKVFMVSSSISGEGKTFTTINLATVFAMSNKKTLIVGADMRRPRIYQDFNRSNDQGLSTYLSGISDFDQVVQNTEIENLFLVSGGPVPPNPSELLLTGKFEEFIKRALEIFDFVLIDTPPLALVTDAFVMSKFVDHTVFVMRQNYSPKEFVRSIDEYYRSGKINNISILLNDIYKSGLGYGYGQSYAYQYGYGYGSYGGYGYYSDESESKLKNIFRKNHDS